MKKPILYIDVDGVLFGIYSGGYMQLRPNVIGFLEWCTANFECCWLTCWGRDRLYSLFYRIYGLPTFNKIRYINWIVNDSQLKVVSIDIQSDFYWIEDGILEDEENILKENGKLDRYVFVNENGRDELEHTQEQLQEILNKRQDSEPQKL
jgi:hypothetical protein